MFDAIHCGIPELTICSRSRQYWWQWKNNRYGVFLYVSSTACWVWDMMTSSNGTIFRVTDHLCGEFPAPWPVTRSFDVFFDLRLNKQLSKQPWGWWFETPPWSLWRQCNGIAKTPRLHIIAPLWEPPFTSGFASQMAHSAMKMVSVSQNYISKCVCNNCLKYRAVNQGMVNRAIKTRNPY